MNLAFDTATRWGRFALPDGPRLLAYHPFNVTGSYADALLPQIEDLLRECGATLADVRGLGVTRGPGSFTGVRIGVATAKALAWGLGGRLVAVPTLEAMAADLLAAEPERELAVPALDARRGQVYAALYRRRGPWVEPVREPAALPPDAWWERLREALPDPEAPAYGGDGVGLLVGQGGGLRPELQARGRPARRSWSAAHPATARALALAMGDPAAGLVPIDPFALAPLYLRPSDAETKRGLDLTPAPPPPGAPPPPEAPADPEGRP